LAAAGPRRDAWAERCARLRQGVLSSWLPHFSAIKPAQYALSGGVLALLADTRLAGVHGRHEGIAVAIFNRAGERSVSVPPRDRSRPRRTMKAIPLPLPSKGASA